MTSETRTCTKCGQTKPIDEYAWRDKTKGTRRRNCKTCGEVVKSAWAKARRQRDRENKQAQKDSETHRQCNRCKQTKPVDAYEQRTGRKPGSWSRRSTCRTCINAERSKRGKLDYQRNKAHHNARNTRWEGANKSRRKAQKHAYYLKNKTHMLARTHAWTKQRMKTDIGFKLAARARSRIAEVLRKIGCRKTNRTLELIGCTAFELKAYLEGLFQEGMTWDKHGVGPGTFQIDHITPLALFNLTDPDEQRKAFHYTNLQPLWYEDHVAKTAIDILRIRRTPGESYS